MQTEKTNPHSREDMLAELRRTGRAIEGDDSIEADAEFLGDERKRWHDVGEALEAILEKCLTAERMLGDLLSRQRNAVAQEMVEMVNEWIIGSIRRHAESACEIVTAVERTRGWRPTPERCLPPSPSEALASALPPLLALERLVAGFDLAGGVELAGDAICQIERARKLMGVEVVGAEGEEEDASDDAAPDEERQ